MLTLPILLISTLSVATQIIREVLLFEKTATTPVDDILDSFEELKTADNATQAQMVMYSKLFKINFTKMDPYEFKTFTDILQRYSDLCKPNQLREMDVARRKSNAINTID